jgi:hypothetical protein
MSLAGKMEIQVSTTLKVTKFACFVSSSAITPTRRFFLCRKKAGHYHRAPFAISLIALANSQA